MHRIGIVESLWRYPVKSMRGEELEEIFAGYAGVYGDRLFAFQSSTGRKGLPFLTGREQNRMLLYRPRFRNPEKAARPINFEEAERLSPLVNPVSAQPADLMLDVETPDGQIIAIDDPGLLVHLQGHMTENHELRLHRSDKAITDCCPLSIISMQSIRRLGEEAGLTADKRRFRANIYLDLHSDDDFPEDNFVGRSLRIGPRVIVQVVARDTRCMIITLDPDTAEKTPAILKAVAQAREGMAGVYAAILAQGIVRQGDPVEVISP